MSFGTDLQNRINELRDEGKVPTPPVDPIVPQDITAPPGNQEPTPPVTTVTTDPPSDPGVPPPVAPTNPLTPDQDYKSLYDQLQAEKAAKEQELAQIRTEAEALKGRFKDPYLANLVDAYEKGEDITPYLEARSINPDTMSGDDLIRRDLLAKFPTVEPHVIQALFEREKAKFNLDSEDPVDQAVGKAQYDAYVNELRAKTKQQYAKYIEPTERQTMTGAKDDELRQQIEAAHKAIDESELTKSLMATGKVEVKHGDLVANVGVDANKIITFAKDPNAFWSAFTKADGSTDFQKFYWVAALAANPEAFISALTSQGKTLGTEEILKQIENPSPPTNATTNPQGLTAQQQQAIASIQMALSGKK
jgi:hypothetical protein